MGTKNSPGEFDCYKAALPDEPIFVLLARDPSAPDLVRAWAAARIGRLGHTLGDDDRKVVEALKCARAMDEWLKMQEVESLAFEAAQLARPKNKGMQRPSRAARKQPLR